MLKKTASSIAVTTLFVFHLEAASFFVSPTGSDSNPGSLSAPFRTVTRGIQALQAGDVLNIRGGTYNEAINGDRIADGTDWTNTTKLQAYNNEAVIIRAPGGNTRVVAFQSATAYVEFHGLKFDAINALYEACKLTEDAHHIKFVNCEFYNAPSHGIVLSNGSTEISVTAHEFINCKIYNNGTVPWGFETHGIYVCTSSNIFDGLEIRDTHRGSAIHNYDGDPSYNIYRYCRVYNNEYGAFRMEHGTGCRVFNNLIWSNGGWGVNVGIKATNLYVLNNTMWDNAGGVDIYRPTGGDIWIENNIINRRSGSAEALELAWGVSSARNIYVRNNFLYGSGGVIFRDIEGQAITSGNQIGELLNPLFVAPSSGDFHIQAGSLCRNTGRSQNFFLDDYEKHSRPQEGVWDIGAFEYTPGGPANTPPTISTIPDQTVNLNTATGPIPFAIGDAETPSTSLTVSGVSSSVTLVPINNLVFGGTGANRTVTITPAPVQTGTATITVTVSDGSASANTSFRLTVLAPLPTNSAPTVSAGSDQTVALPNALTINGSATDDGLPIPPGILTTTWSKVSGPGTVSFGNPNASIATASFSAEGTYVLRLSASDGLLSASDDVSVTVTAAPSSTSIAIEMQAEAGALVSPMTVATDLGSTNGSTPTQPVQYIYSTTSYTGSATYTVGIPAAGDYIVWCRVIAGPTNDSFYVSVDGTGEDVYHLSEVPYSTNWRWSRVNGGSLSINPRIFTFSQGTHSIQVRAREANTYLDRLIVTNDPNLVPLDPSSGENALRILSISKVTSGLALTWASVPGTSYRVGYKDSLAVPNWTFATANLLASGSTMYWVDPDSATATQRFYAVQVVP